MISSSVVSKTTVSKPVPSSVSPQNEIILVLADLVITFGIVGFFLESTRKFYLRKLAEIMNGGGDKTETEVEAANASTMVNGKSPGRSSPKKKTTKKITNGLDQFSADEETADEQQPEVIVSKSRANTTTTSTTSKTLTPTSLRQRIKGNSGHVPVQA